MVPLLAKRTSPSLTRNARSAVSEIWTKGMSAKETFGIVINIGDPRELHALIYICLLGVESLLVLCSDRLDANNVPMRRNLPQPLDAVVLHWDVRVEAPGEVAIRLSAGALQCSGIAPKGQAKSARHQPRSAKGKAKAPVKRARPAAALPVRRDLT